MKVKLFIALMMLSSAAQAQYYGYGGGGISPGCQFAWTADCERQNRIQENLYREQMLEQIKRQNRALQQQPFQSQGYEFDNPWKTLR